MCFAIIIIVGQVFLNIFKTSRTGLMIVTVLPIRSSFRGFLAVNISYSSFYEDIKTKSIIVIGSSKANPIFKRQCCVEQSHGSI